MKIYWNRIYYIIWFKSNSRVLPTLLITLGNIRKKPSFFILKRSTYSSLRYLSSFFSATGTWCSISIITCIPQPSRRTSIHWNFNCVWLLIWKEKKKEFLRKNPTGSTKLCVILRIKDIENVCSMIINFFMTLK